MSETPIPVAPSAQEAPDDVTAESVLPLTVPAKLAVGERIEGTLAEAGLHGRIGLADGRQVSIDGTELTGENAVEVGGPIEAFVVRIDPSGEIWVSRSKGSAALLLLLNARDHEDTVMGRVVAQGPAGLEVDLGGGIFAICPPAEIGDDVDNPGHLVGQSLDFKVKDATPTKVTLSRKAALGEESAAAASSKPKLTPEEAEKKAEEAAEVRRRLRPGATMAGRIVRLRDFGAFVDLGGGVEGLVHLSELAHERVASPKDVVHVGQPVEVQVLKVDYDAHKGERISLSLKALTKSAWEAALATLKEGERRKGTVRRLESFGAFVELFPGVAGLLHVSALGGKKHAHPSELLKAGDEIEVEVLGIDKDKHRISLKRVLSETEMAEKKAKQTAIREEKRAEAKAKRDAARQKPHERHKPGDIVEAVVDRIEPYGIFFQLKGGGRGMVHVSEMGPAPEGKEALPLAEKFPKGTKLTVAVLEIDAEHRIRLSRAAVPEIEKGTTPEGYLKHKTQHELEEKLLRSASKPIRPRVGRPSRPAPSGKRATPPPSGEATAAAPEARPAPRNRGDKRPERRDANPKRPGQSGGGLGTLGDLLKVKLQQRKG